MVFFLIGGKECQEIQWKLYNTKCDIFYHLISPIVFENVLHSSYEGDMSDKKEGYLKLEEIAEHRN